jgi:hypothetical protein
VNRLIGSPSSSSGYLSLRAYRNEAQGSSDARADKVSLVDGSKVAANASRGLKTRARELEVGTLWGLTAPSLAVLSGLYRHITRPSHLHLGALKGLVGAIFLRSGAAQELNLPTGGLRRLTGLKLRRA